MSIPKVTIPVCSDCGAVSVLDPCRACATPADLASLPLAPFERGPVEVAEYPQTEQEK